MNLNIIVLISLCFWIPWLGATEDPHQAKRLIKEILEQPEFQTTRETHHWRYRGEKQVAKKEVKKKEESNPTISFQIAQALEWFLWILVGIGSILVIILVRNHFGLFSFSFSTPPSQVLTTKLSIKESLPPHLARQAWKLWQAGEARASISLLYRGTLTVLSTQGGLNLQESATERECLNWVKHHHPPFHDYFSRLTVTWQAVAYAQRLPVHEEVQQLCEEWTRYFGG